MTYPSKLFLNSALISSLVREDIPAPTSLRFANDPRADGFGFADVSMDSIQGTSGDDTLDGTMFADTILGLAGADTLNGLDGNDLLFSDGFSGDKGTEVDTLNGGDGLDTLYIGFGDNADGGNNLDTLNIALGGATSGVSVDFTAMFAGGSTNLGGGILQNIEYINRIDATVFADTITIGGILTDGPETTIRGYDGNDVFNGGANPDRLFGDEGDDQLNGLGGPDDLRGGNGNDQIDGGDGDDILSGGAGSDTITGGDGNDFIGSVGRGEGLTFAADTGIEIDTIFGGNGDDSINVGYGDSADGGIGFDLLTANFTTSIVGVNADFTGNGSGSTVNIAGGIIQNMEMLNIVGSQGDDTIISGTVLTPGFGVSDLLQGNDGDDFLQGGQGNDRIDGNRGADTLNGMDGDDLLLSGDYNTPFGPFFIDTLNGGAGNDALYAGHGDNVDGGTGTDTAFLDFRASTSGLNVDFSTMFAGGSVVVGGGTIQNIESINYFYATDMADTIVLGTTTPTGGTLGSDITILGMDGDDHITGGATADWIIGGDGDDQIFGLGGSDQLDGGDGDDIIENGSGVSVIYGGLGADIIRGGNGFDQIHTGASLFGPFDMGLEVDTVEAGDGDDSIIAGLGDHVDGGNGIDLLSQISFLISGVGVIADFTNASTSTGVTIAGGVIKNIEAVASITGSNHDDVIVRGLSGVNSTYNMTGGEGNDHLTGANVNESINGGAGNDKIYGLGGIDFLSGGSGDDQLFGGTDNDILSGDSGTNILDGGLGNDTLNGGSGLDIASYSGANGALNIDLNNLSGGNFADQGTDSFSSIEGLSGGAFDDFLIGDSGTNILNGGLGSDELIGNAGNDTLNGGNNDDILDGGTGTDTASYANAGSGVRVKLALQNVSQNTLGGGRDTLISIERLVGSSHDDVLRGDASNNRIDGGAGNDRINAGSGDDLIFGDAGDDVIEGAGGNDTMRGGLGDDSYTIRDAGDVIIENAGEGIDSVKSQIDYTLGDNVETLALVGGARVGTGNALDNTIFGRGGGDTLSGLAGNDIIRGGNAADSIDGGAGNDLIDGGQGKDIMTGGANKDTFQFRFASDFNATRNTADVIADFNQGEGDKIQLNAIDANINTGANDAFEWIATNAFSSTAGEMRYQQIAGDTFIEGDTDGDGQADMMIRLTGLHTLDATDIIGASDVQANSAPVIPSLLLDYTELFEDSWMRAPDLSKMGNGMVNQNHQPPSTAFAAKLDTASSDIALASVAAVSENDVYSDAFSPEGPAGFAVAPAAAFEGEDGSHGLDQTALFDAPMPEAISLYVDNLI